MVWRPDIGPPATMRSAVRVATDDGFMDLRALLVGTRQTIAGTVYGTIVVLSVVTAGAKAAEHDPWGLGALTAVTALVFWLAHVYSHALGESLNLGRRITSGELAAIGRRESSIVLAAVLPVTMIMLGAVGVLGEGAALWLAVGVGVATLVAQGIRYARLERLSRAWAIVTIAVNLALGLVLALLKALLAH